MFTGHKVVRYFNVTILLWQLHLDTDNVTMFTGHKVVYYCNITIFGVATPSRLRELNIFQIFLVPEALLRCCEAIKWSRAQL